jgi:hypothetical protein
MGYRTETPSELLVRIRVILAEIPREILNAVFLEWMERLQKCVQVNGEYVGWAKRTFILKLILIVRFACGTFDVGHPIVSGAIQCITFVMMDDDKLISICDLTQLVGIIHRMILFTLNFNIARYILIHIKV